MASAAQTAARKKFMQMIKGKQGAGTGSPKLGKSNAKTPIKAAKAAMKGAMPAFKKKA